MADTLVVETAGGTTEEELERKLEKKRAKIRSAWISFVGRIVAQIMGAVATISLGLMLVQKYHSPSAAPAPEPGAECAARDLPRAPRHAWCILPGRSATPRRLCGRRDVVRTGDDRRAHHRSGAPRRGPRRLAHVVGCLRKGGRPLPQIARELGVDFIVEGSVTKADGRVRIALSLIDARRDEQLLAAVLRSPAAADPDRSGRGRPGDSAGHQRRIGGAVGSPIRRDVTPTDRPAPEP